MPLSLTSFTASVRLPRAAIVGLLAATLSGCASMTPEECLTANWHEQGLRDGMNGEPRAYIEEHRKACSKVGVVPDARQYELGRAEGIRQYCTPQNGREQGRRGRSYQRSCPPELEGPFLEEYRAGRRVYDAEKRVEWLVSEQRTKESELSRAKDDETRERIRRKLRDLDYQLRSARDQLSYEERRLYR